MKHIFMVNRFSLKSKIDSYVEKLRKVSKRLKLDYLIEINDDNNSTEDILRKYTKTKNIIYAVGGDGSLNRVVNALHGSKNIIGCIPLGTGNDFHRTMAEFFKPGINDVDLIKCNDKYFINVACFGVDADIANDEKIVHNKLIPKSQQYNVSVLKHIILFKPYTFKMQWDNKETSDKLALVTVCNANYYGGGYHANPNGLCDDGKMDIYIVRASNRRKVIKYLLKILKSKQTTLDFVEHIRTNRFVITNNKIVGANLDGEKLEDKQFEISVIPKGIKVYYNKELIDLMNA